MNPPSCPWLALAKVNYILTTANTGIPSLELRFKVGFASSVYEGICLTLSVVGATVKVNSEREGGIERGGREWEESA